MIDLYVSKHRIDFIDVWVGHDSCFYVNSNENGYNYFFNYFNGIYQYYSNSLMYESEWKYFCCNYSILYSAQTNKFYQDDIP